MHGSRAEWYAKLVQDACMHAHRGVRACERARMVRAAHAWCMHACICSAKLLDRDKNIWAASVPKPLLLRALPEPQKFIMSHLFGTPPASNRRASLSTPMSAPPAGRVLTLHEPETVPDAAHDHRALWRLQSAVPEAEAEARVPSPHYLTRSLEAPPCSTNTTARRARAHTHSGPQARESQSPWTEVWPTQPALTLPY